MHLRTCPHNQSRNSLHKQPDMLWEPWSPLKRVKEDWMLMSPVPTVADPLSPPPSLSPSSSDSLDSVSDEPSGKKKRKSPARIKKLTVYGRSPKKMRQNTVKRKKRDQVLTKKAAKEPKAAKPSMKDAKPRKLPKAKTVKELKSSKSPKTPKQPKKTKTNSETLKENLHVAYSVEPHVMEELETFMAQQQINESPFTSS